MNAIFSNILKYRYFFWLLVFSVSAAAQEGLSGSPHRVTARQVPDSAVSRMKKQKDFLYANDPSTWPKKDRTDYSGLARLERFFAYSTLIKWILYMLLAALVVFAIRQVLAANGLRIFGARKRKTKVAEAFTGEEVKNIDDLIRQSVQERRFREATRYLYLKTLQQLHEHHLIRLQSKATNYDYVLQMAASAHAKDFVKLTRTFDYVWYGEFQPNSEQFHFINDQFKHFISGI